jgi:ADP-ribosylglycohydrolase
MEEVVNRRGDADTNGAIYGGLAGAVFGVRGIPQRWRRGLRGQDLLSQGLRALCGNLSSA